MECVEAKAFKTSLWRPEMLVKSSSPATTNPQQVVFFHGEEEEVFKTNGLFSNNGGGDEETFVDEFLDFSNEVIAKEEETEEEIYQTVEAKVNNNTEMTMKAVFSPEKSLKNDFATELSVPTDDLADLEWLSHFVEDSFSEEFSQTQYNDGNPTVLAKPVVKTENHQFKPENHQFKPEPQFIKTESIETVSFTFSPQQPPHLPQLCQPTPAAAAATTVPGKARSKRARTGGRVWSLGGYSSLPETSSSSSTNTGTTTSSTSSSSSYLLFHNDRAPDTYFYESLRKPPVMKQKKQRVFVNDDEYGGYGGGARAAMRTQCSHCGVTKTPQWRTGPLGAKTLCNACGVRFKSGRLLPEYRPASSPSFSREVHSNSHRKVLEMRKKKEVVGAPEPGFTPAVHSF